MSGGRNLKPHKTSGRSDPASHVIQETDVLDATTLPKVRIPNRDNFLTVEIDLKPGQRRPLGHYP